MTTVSSHLWLDPGNICRMNGNDIADRIIQDKGFRCNLIMACLWIVFAGACYGAVFGIWHSPWQACFSAAKMPVLILSVTVVSMLINIMLAQAWDSGMSSRQVCVCILLTLAVMSIVLASVSPVLLFFTLQMPAPGEPGELHAYRFLLFLNTIAVGISGVIGNICLYRLLNRITGSARKAIRVLISWILVAGLAGCELSWVLSPFLARPDVPLPFFNPNAFKSNFFEYLWRNLWGTL